MEGMPRLPMLTPEFKVSPPSLPPEFSAKIKEYIQTHYEDDPSKYESALSEIESLKTKFARPYADVETACQMKRYFAQLSMMKSRFPMEDGDPIRIPFTWLDKAIDMPGSTVYEDVNFELACVMFDIGAVHGAIGANESRADMDSIKNAFTHFQCAAYPLQEIRDHMNASKYACVDFEPSYLTFFVNILLAQAQECMLEKSLIDHRKNTVVAKIAIHLRDVYKQCRDLLESSVLNDVISTSKYKEWLRTCDVKSDLYGAIGMVQLGEQADVEKKMGHRLAYYQLAANHVKEAMKHVEKDRREALTQAVLFANDVVIGKETNAKKENDFIYHDRIPKAEELRVVEGVSMVKAIGFDATDRSIAGDDLFAALLPMNVIRSVSMYSEEKANLKRLVLQKVAEKDKQLDEYLASLQLDEVNIDSSVDELNLPDMLLERSAALSAQPHAFPDLLDKLQRVGSCAIEADHKLDDLLNRLSAIDSPDITTDKGFTAIKKELTRINEHHMKARSNNTELQRAIAAHSENLRILTMPIHELNRRISGPAIKPSETAEGALLKRLLNKTAEMRAQRCQLVADLGKELDADDITLKCLADKHSDGTELYKKELAKHDEMVKLIDMNLSAQANILSALTEANAGFAECRRQVTEINKSRAEQILALTAAYDVCMDVRHKADEGLKFYSTLFSMVRVLDEAIEGIENAFEEEKKKKEEEKRKQEEEKRKLEEKARELRLAREAKEALGQFHAPNARMFNAALPHGGLPVSNGMHAVNAATLRSLTDPLAASSAMMRMQSPSPTLTTAHTSYVTPSTMASVQNRYGNASVLGPLMQQSTSYGLPNATTVPVGPPANPAAQVSSGIPSMAPMQGFPSSTVPGGLPSTVPPVSYVPSSVVSPVAFPPQLGGTFGFSGVPTPVSFGTSTVGPGAGMGQTGLGGVHQNGTPFGGFSQSSATMPAMVSSSNAANAMRPAATFAPSAYGMPALPTGQGQPRGVSTTSVVQDPFDMASTMAGFQNSSSTMAPVQTSFGGMSTSNGFQNSAYAGTGSLNAFGGGLPRPPAPLQPTPLRQPVPNMGESLGNQTPCLAPTVGTPLPGCASSGPTATGPSGMMPSTVTNMPQGVGMGVNFGSGIPTGSTTDVNSMKQMTGRMGVAPATSTLPGTMAAMPAPSNFGGVSGFAMNNSVGGQNPWAITDPFH